MMFSAIVFSNSSLSTAFSSSTIVSLSNAVFLFVFFWNFIATEAILLLNFCFFLWNPCPSLPFPYKFSLKRFWIKQLLNFTTVINQIWLRQSYGSLKLGQLYFIRNMIFSVCGFWTARLLFWGNNRILRNPSFLKTFCKKQCQQIQIKWNFLSFNFELVTWKRKSKSYCSS